MCVLGGGAGVLSKCGGCWGVLRACAVCWVTCALSMLALHRLVASAAAAVTCHCPCPLQGFDEVIQALPPAAGMGNLLLDLAGATSACLGVLVEAFPNKEAVLVDHLKALEELVNRWGGVKGGEGVFWGMVGVVWGGSTQTPNPQNDEQ